MYEPRTITFTVPSGAIYTIREQNGEDEDILTNTRDIKNNQNINKFLAAIIVSKSENENTKGNRVNIADVLDMPLLDKYAILFYSRIFSIGDSLEFSYEWDKETKIEYEQNLLEYIYEDYSNVSEEEIESKPNAIKKYPLGSRLKDIEVTLFTGKKIKFDIATGNSEIFMMNLPESKRTRNSELLAHNLCLEVDGKYERVQNFSMFNLREMAEIRSNISKVDPNFEGVTDIENPTTGEVVKYPILADSHFFFLTGV